MKIDKTFQPKRMSYKKRLTDHLVLELEANYKMALIAAKRAHSTATDKENIAENKYDTLGLEAAYLAQGQAKRASECGAELQAVQNLPVVELSSTDAIVVGTLVSIIDQHEQQLSLFLAPVGGGLKFVFQGKNIVVITQSSPLGKNLVGRFVDDEFELATGPNKKIYRISDIY